MLEKVQELAEVMVKQSSNLRIAFNEADATTSQDLEAQHFLKLDENRLGRDFKLYAFMAQVTGEDGVIIRLLEELVLPLENQSPQAYLAGLSYLQEQGDVFGEDKQAWKTMIENLKPPKLKP